MSHEKNSQIKFILAVVVSFCLVTLCCLILDEFVKLLTAKNLGYPNYSFRHGRLVYENLNSKFSTEWIKHSAYIELASKLFIVTITLTGLIMLYNRRSFVGIFFSPIDWILLFFTLYAMKSTLWSAFFILHGGVWCDYGMFAEYFNLKLFLTEWVILAYGLTIAFLAFRIVPRNQLMPLLASLGLSGILTILLWLSFTF